MRMQITEKIKMELSDDALINLGDEIIWLMNAKWHQRLLRKLRNKSLRFWRRMTHGIYKAKRFIL